MLFLNFHMNFCEVFYSCKNLFRIFLKKIFCKEENIDFFPKGKAVIQILKKQIEQKRGYKYSQTFPELLVFATIFM